MDETADEALAPFRAEVERLGMTDEDLAEFFAPVIRMVRAERRYNIKLKEFEVNYAHLVTRTPGKRSGQPCIRDTRITVNDINSYLDGGMSVADICADFPELTELDVGAAIAFRAELGDKYKIVASPYFWLQLDAARPGPYLSVDDAIKQIDTDKHLRDTIVAINTITESGTTANSVKPTEDRVERVLDRHDTERTSEAIAEVVDSVENTVMVAVPAAIEAEVRQLISEFNDDVTYDSIVETSPEFYAELRAALGEPGARSYTSGQLAKELGIDAESMKAMRRSLIKTDPYNGSLVFTGSRIPVNALLDYLESGALDKFIEEHPELSRKHITTTIEYALCALVGERYE